MSGDDQISAEARELAERVRERAAAMDAAAGIADVTAEALAGGGTEMSPEEIRHLFRDAIGHAQQVSFLLGQLAGILDRDPAGEP